MVRPGVVVDVRLRPYQERDLGRLLGAFRGVRRVLYRLPTGGGKTVLFSQVLAMARGQCLVLTHRRELVLQAVRALSRIGCSPGVTCAGMVDPHPQASIRVASVATLNARGLPEGFAPSFVVVDETHLAAARTWRAVLEGLGDVHVLGVTATPERLDGQALGDIYERMIEGPTIRELIDAGHLVEPLTYTAPGEARTRDDGLDVPTLVGEVVDTYERLADSRTGLVFASSVAHAALLAEQFNARGIRAELVTGETKDRDQILARLASGETRIVCNYGVLTEGFDEPSISYIGIARCTQSLALWLQMCGRGLRTAPGKVDCVIADHGGNAALRHGPVDVSRTWSLAGRRKRKAADLDAALSVSTCGQCLALWFKQRSTSCPRCGAAPEPVERRLPEQLRGQLERRTAREWEARRREASRKMPIRPAPSWCPPGLWNNLERRRQERGYLPSWTVGAARRTLARERRFWR